MVIIIRFYVAGCATHQVTYPEIGRGYQKHERWKAFTRSDLWTRLSDGQNWKQLWRIFKMILESSSMRNSGHPCRSVEGSKVVPHEDWEEVAK